LIRNGIMITKNSSQFVIPTINRVAEYTHTHTHTQTDHYKKWHTILLQAPLNV